VPLPRILRQVGTGFIRLRIGTGGGNEPLGSIKGGEFLD
jgi:hypothetical protein